MLNRLIVADELDYLITKDRAVLHELFMLTTLPFSRFILIGIGALRLEMSNFLGLIIRCFSNMTSFGIVRKELC